MKAKPIRLFIVLGCYALSSLGIYGSLLWPFLLWASGHSPISLLTLAVVLFAWTCHLIMCFKWIGNENISYFWMKIGTISGVSSLFLSIPLSDLVSKYGLSLDALIALLQKMSMLAIFVLPAILLAIFLMAQQQKAL